jgi:hypothetical protein
MVAMKTLYEYMSDAATEYDIEVFAGFDIHNQDAKMMINKVFYKYGLCKGAEEASSKPMAPKHTELPNITMAPLFSVKVKTSILPNLGAVGQELAAEFRKSQDLFALKEKSLGLINSQFAEYERDFSTLKLDSPYCVVDKELTWVKDPDTKGNQDLVGMKRINTVLAAEKKKSEELAASLRKREKAIMTHLGMKEILGENRTKGYYVVSLDKDGKLLEEHGPLKSKPEGLLIDSFAKLKAFSSQ